MTVKENGPTSSNQSHTGHPWFWLVVLSALALWLRLIGVNRGLWWDEIYFLLMSVRHPLAEIVTTFPADIQHPLYSVLAKMSVLGFGESPWTLRLPAVLFGAASVPALYFLGASVGRRVEALLSAALLAVSYHHVWFSQNARGYTALAFFTILSTYLLLRGIETGRRGPYVAYAVAAALGVYTHLTMMFVVVSHALICAALVASNWRKQPGTRSWNLPLLAFSLAGGLTALLYAPILIQVRNFFHRPSAMLAVSTPSWALRETLRGLIAGLGAGSVLLAAGLLVACGAWSYFRQSRTVFALFALPGLLTALGAVAARGTMYPRFYFSLIGFAILIVTRGVFAASGWMAARSPRHGLAPALTAVSAGILLAGSGYSLLRNYRFPKQDFEGAMRFIDAENKDRDTVVTVGAAMYPMRQYFAKAWESAETAGRLEDICRRGQPLWLMYTFPRYLEAAAPGSLEVIRKDFKIVRIFPGTLGDGDVYVGKFSPEKLTSLRSEVGHP